MATRNTGNTQRSRQPRGRTLEERENQMIALAMDLVEKKLTDGTATSQETTHFLKLATVREQKEREKLALETQLLAARTDQIKNAARTDEIYAEALAAMREYQGADVDYQNRRDYDE